MSSPVYLKARRHLGRRDPVLKQIIATVGPCTLSPTEERFGALISSIISQQISTKAAASIKAKLVQSLGAGGLTPTAILDLSDEQLRAVGLSTAKTRSVRHLAESVHAGEVPLHDIELLDDEAVIQRLLPVRGIGRWTAEMFLIFSLGRLDVLPVADYGFRAAVRYAYGLDELPEKEALVELGEPWRPYRSIATWYFWRSLHARETELAAARQSLKDEKRKRQKGKQ